MHLDVIKRESLYDAHISFCSHFHCSEKEWDETEKYKEFTDFSRTTNSEFHVSSRKKNFEKIKGFVDVRHTANDWHLFIVVGKKKHPNPINMLGDKSFVVYLLSRDFTANTRKL